MANILATPTLVINNQAIYVVPNSVSFTEGMGEQSMRTQSAGGGITDQIYSDNAETKMSSIKFKLYSTSDNINLALQWKKNRNNNAISLTGQTDQGTYLSRAFNRAALLNDYETNVQADGTLDLEFKSDPAV